jgi:hypothetical protein
MRSLALVLVLSVGACAGDDPTTVPACSAKVYDPCRDEHDCTSDNCRPFGAIQVCTQSCNTDSPCPNDADGNTVTCDMTSLMCQPTVANNCTLN